MRAMKKILVVHTTYRNIGGEDIAVNNEIKLLQKYFHVEKLFFSNNDKNFIRDLISLLFNKNSFSKKLLKDKLKLFQPDIIYVHNTWYKPSLEIFDLIKDQNTINILKLHNFRYSCTKSFFSSRHLNGKQICPACGYKKKPLSIFNKYFNESYFKSLFAILYGKKYLNIIKNLDFVFVLTDFHKNFLRDKNYRNKEIINLPNYIEIKENNYTKKPKDYFIYAGRISEEKGIKDLIKSFQISNFSDIYLKIVGDGPELNKLKTKYHDINIEFTGFRENKEVLDLISDSLGVVTATTLYEGQPTLLCEASLLEVPSIFPINGGIAEFFPENYKFSYDQSNPDDLSKKMIELSKNNNSELYGKECKKFILDKLNEDKLISKFQEIIGSHER